MDRTKRNLLVTLIAFPAVYFLYSLTSWSRGLFVEGNSDLFIPFWSGIVLFHWASLFVVRAFLKQEGKGFKEIGYGLNTKKTLLLVCSYLFLALLFFGFTEFSLKYVSIDEAKLASLSNFFPKTTGQRLLFILTVFSAGFCEEIIYRGYAITKLRDAKLNKWIALIPAGLAFTLTHGIISVTSFEQFGFYFSFALVMGAIFILSKRLLPSIIIHLLFDLTAMMAVFQAISR